MNGSRNQSIQTSTTTSAMQSGAQSPQAEMDTSTNLHFTELSPQLLKDSSRIDVDSLMNEFRQELGAERWENYRDSLTHFLMGKLSRAELVRCLREQLGLNGAAMKNHNTLVLSLLTNACREAPPGAESSLADWKANTRGKSKHSGMEASNDLLHKEILSMPVRERRRIKNIAKDAPNYLREPIYPIPPLDLEASRYAMLPRIPIPVDQSRLGANEGAAGPNGKVNGTLGANAGASGSAGAGAAGNLRAGAGGMNAGRGTVGSAAAAAAAAAGVASDNRREKEKDTNPLMDPLLNLHPGRTSGPLTWTQDILQGFETPLISESHELPDESTLGTRMLSLALENGVLGGIGPGTTDIMLLGLESYFRSIIDQLFELKHRKVTSSNPLSAEDFNLLADLRPNEFVERTAPLLRLRSYYLQDEETDEEEEQVEEGTKEPTKEATKESTKEAAKAPAKSQDGAKEPTDTVKVKSEIKNEIKSEDDELKRVNPWNFEEMRPKRLKAEESEEKSEAKRRALEGHEKGISIVDQLLR